MSTTETQKKEHIYLTNGCCEDTNHVGRRKMAEFGLKHGWWNRSVGKVFTNTDPDPEGNIPVDCDFYPLTAEEASLISETGFYTGEGYVGHTGYSTLYQGKKWLTPTLEIEWHNEEKARYGYKPEDMHAPTSDEALKIARLLMARATNRLERIGGYAEIEEDTQGELDEVQARWTVAIHIPMDWAVENLCGRDRFAFQCYSAFLRGVML